MATKKPARRIVDPEEKYMGSEPTWDTSLGEEWEGREISLIQALNWYNHFSGRKDWLNEVYEYARLTLKLDKESLANLRRGGTMFLPTTIGALIRMQSRGFVLNEKEASQIASAIQQNIVHGSKQKPSEEKSVAATVVISPQERLRGKVNTTIMEDLRQIEDAWLEGRTPEIDAYERMKVHDLPAMAVGMVTPWVEARISEMQEAVDKTCPQCVEAFSHLSKRELNARLKLLNKVLEDLKRHQTNTKVVRKTRVKKATPVTKVVERVQYLKESPEFKLVSVTPSAIVGAKRLFTFNVKTRTLSEYVAEGPSGLSVKGTTLTGWNAENSRNKKLRKPEEVLPVVLGKTIRQINNALTKLTTREAAPNGRLNKDTILVRVANA